MVQRMFLESRDFARVLGLNVSVSLGDFGGFYCYQLEIFRDRSTDRNEI